MIIEIHVPSGEKVNLPHARGKTVLQQVTLNLTCLIFRQKLVSCKYTFTCMTQNVVVRVTMKMYSV